jgi:hypothetical protein
MKLGKACICGCFFIQTRKRGKLHQACSRECRFRQLRKKESANEVTKQANS